MGDSGAQVLATLKDAPSLHTLSLDLVQNSVGESGALALAALKDAASLHTLSLDLRGNSLGESGAQALAALKDAPSLHSLSLRELFYPSLNCLPPSVNYLTPLCIIYPPP